MTRISGKNSGQRSPGRAWAGVGGRGRTVGVCLAAIVALVAIAGPAHAANWDKATGSTYTLEAFVEWNPVGNRIEFWARGRNNSSQNRSLSLYIQMDRFDFNPLTGWSFVHRGEEDRLCTSVSTGGYCFTQPAPTQMTCPPKGTIHKYNGRSALFVKKENQPNGPLLQALELRWEDADGVICPCTDP